MDVKVILDWRTIAALGVLVVPSILALKLDGESAKTVFIHSIDAVNELAIAKSNR